VSGKIGVSASSAGDEKLLDQSESHSAVDADATSQQLQQISLTADQSYNIDRVLTDDRTSSDMSVAIGPTEAAVAVANGRTQRWTSDGFVNDWPKVSDNFTSLDVDDQLTYAGNDCDELSVGSIRNQQSSVFSGSNLASFNDITHCEAVCECCLDTNESHPTCSELVQLFSCRECSVSCSKHLAHDGIHLVLHMLRHSEVDRSVFDDASLVVVENEIYVTKVIKHDRRYFCVLSFYLWIMLMILVEICSLLDMALFSTASTIECH